MSPDQIVDQLREWLATLRLDPRDEWDGDAIDSLEGVQLILFAEQRWGIAVPDGDLRGVVRSLRLLAVEISTLASVRAEGTVQ
jgi:acyl carrier protein